jgi:SAM-dependent methyltransferase
MASIDEETAERVGKYWDGASDSSTTDKIAKFMKQVGAEKRLPVSGWGRSMMLSRVFGIGWWHNPFVVRCINKRICGYPIDGRSQGLIHWLRDSYGHLFPLERGISVGCGDGSKEALFLQAGIVSTFDLYELSEKSIERGRLVSRRLGLEDRMHFHRGIALEEVQAPDSYDLVAWNDALHHMPSVDEALAWSRMILKTGGVFSLDDFVGATRFQWPDEQLAIAQTIREAIPIKYRALPRSPFEYLPTAVARPTVESMIAIDPSEAADSAQILPMLAHTFPEVSIRKTGGVVYHLALHEVMHNFHPDQDACLLQLLMLIDELCIATGNTHYAAAIGQKSTLRS